MWWSRKKPFLPPNPRDNKRKMDYEERMLRNCLAGVQLIVFLLVYLLWLVVTTPP